MKKEYILILITYVCMLLSPFFGTPLFTFIWKMAGVPEQKAILNGYAYWSIFAFLATLFIILWLLRKERSAGEGNLRDKPKASVGISIAWAIGGIFIAIFAQNIAVRIEQLVGINTVSENTSFIMQMIKSIPLFVILTSIIGPILEEIVFRKIIFGTIYKKYNFFISALVSSVIFGLAHRELPHILLYSAIGFTFAFLYVRTNRILVPIFAHVMMNTLVVIVQLKYDDIMQSIETVQSIIGGIL
ncbi:CPBP family intramembrane glutamic endopeptidase [Bacillus sp. 1P06AnD]|uniref:CPBP family intramembrane glutamic endopeptidase n=1 Tax=Bacillus sp. 1P06AnD TaxID=3132208 RepID=UPI0039A0A303